VTKTAQLADFSQYAMVVSVTRSQPNSTLTGGSGEAPSAKNKYMEFLVEECHIPPIEFQTLVECMPRHIVRAIKREGVLERTGRT
jgi:hypothetical protein